MKSLMQAAHEKWKQTTPPAEDIVAMIIPTVIISTDMYLDSLYLSWQ